MFGTTDMKIFSFEGSLERDGQQQSFVANIEEPNLSSPDGEECVCVIHAPSIFGVDRKIYGVDADQARQLAVDFLKSMLSGFTVRDKSGRSVDVSQWRSSSDEQR
jgi:hypothetical protein